VLSRSRVVSGRPRVSVVDGRWSIVDVLIFDIKGPSLSVIVMDSCFLSLTRHQVKGGYIIFYVLGRITTKIGIADATE
jgi:hypothetical protein